MLRICHLLVLKRVHAAQPSDRLLIKCDGGAICLGAGVLLVQFGKHPLKPGLDRCKIIDHVLSNMLRPRPRFPGPLAT